MSILLIFANSSMCDLGDRINNFLIVLRKPTWNWGAWNWVKVRKNEQKYKNHRKLMGEDC